MQIATIVPTAHLHMVGAGRYHLCLAHQIASAEGKMDLDYVTFFKRMAEDSFVICDNGAAEFGVPMGIDRLLKIAYIIGCQELVLPDIIRDSAGTILSSYTASVISRMQMPILRLMAVPHGESEEEWIACLETMLGWGIDTVGISKFIVPSPFASRVEALIMARSLIQSDKAIHLLGYTGVIGEVQEIERLFPGRVRGIDSSIAMLHTLSGQHMVNCGKINPRPKAELDLGVRLNENLLRDNIRSWKSYCLEGSWT